MKKNMLICTLALSCIGLPLAGGNTVWAAATQTAAAQNVTAQEEYSLDFDRASFAKETYSLNGETVACRSFRGIVYVKHPQSVKYQLSLIHI